MLAVYHLASFCWKCFAGGAAVVGVAAIAATKIGAKSKSDRKASTSEGIRPTFVDIPPPPEPFKPSITLIDADEEGVNQ